MTEYTYTPDSVVIFADEAGFTLARVGLTGPDRDPTDAALTALAHLDPIDRAAVRLIFVRQGEEVTRVR